MEVTDGNSIRTIGQIPVAPRRDDDTSCREGSEQGRAELARANTSALRRHVATQRQEDPQRWRSVRMRAFHALGNAIAYLEAVEAGEEEMRGDGGGCVYNIDSMTIAEDLACKRGACLRVAEALKCCERSLQAAINFHPRQREDLVLCEVRVALKKGA